MRDHDDPGIPAKSGHFLLGSVIYAEHFPDMRLKAAKRICKTVLRTDCFFPFFIIVKPRRIRHLIDNHFRSGKIEINQPDKVLVSVDQDIGEVLIPLKNASGQIPVYCPQL